MNSFVSGSSRDESQLVENVSKDDVTKSITYSFIHQIKCFCDGFHIFKGDAVMLFIPFRLIGCGMFLELQVNLRMLG